MSALEFSKQGSGLTTCEGAECIQKGRRRMYLAGYPVPSEQKYGLRSTLLLCNRCSKEVARIYEGALRRAEG